MLDCQGPERCVRVAGRDHGKESEPGKAASVGPVQETLRQHDAAKTSNCNEARPSTPRVRILRCRIFGTLEYGNASAVHLLTFALEISPHHI